MDPHPITAQISALEAQVLSLRDSLTALPLEQHALAAANLERVQALLAELRAAVNPSSTEVPSEASAAGEETVVWTAERTTRLYAINTALSLALTHVEAAEVVVSQALPALLADAGGVLLQDGDKLTLIATAGIDTAGDLDSQDVNGESPFGQAVLTSQALWIQGPHELKSRFPTWTAPPWSLADSLAVVPLIGEGRVLGVMAFTFDEARPFTIADRAFTLVLAQQCAAALERVHLYQRVRHAAVLEERNRLARDLHDSVSQALYSIVLAASVGTRNLTADPGKAAQALDTIRSSVALAQADLRALLFDLRADSVAKAGLVNSLKERARFMRLRHGIAVRTELCAEPSLEPQCKEALYGIAREALHNAAKHARASQIDLRLAMSPEGLILEIKDNGTGFEPGEHRPGHYGIQSMRERAAELGASLRIDSAPNQGTRILTVVPARATAAGGKDSLPCADTGGS